MEENIIRNEVINNKEQKRKYWRMIRYLMGDPGKHTGKSKNYKQIMQDLLMVDVGIWGATSKSIFSPTMSNNISLRLMNLLLIFLLILPTIFISHHHRNFSDPKTSKFRPGKIQFSPTSQPRLYIHSINIYLIIPLFITFHHR